MEKVEVVVDFGGIVLFDYSLLEEYFGKIEIDENLYRKFITTKDGDEVVKQGIVVPIVGINDSSYNVVIRFSDEVSEIKDELIIFENGEFPLHVKNKIVVADLAVLLEWDPGAGWIELNIPTGFYGVTIRGWQKIENNEVSNYGFEIILRESSTLPEFTGSLTKGMQVNSLPDNF